MRALGDTWAVARESTAGSPFWVVSRYDWADLTVIRMTVEESSWGGSGTESVRVAPVDGGGSRVHAEWTHTGVSRTRDTGRRHQPIEKGTRVFDVASGA